MYARIIDGIAVDLSVDPATQFHPDLAAQFVQVPDAVQPGWVIDPATGLWSAPEPPPPPEPEPVPAPPRTLSHFEFSALLTLAEKIVMTNIDDPEFVKEHAGLKRLTKMQVATLRTAVAVFQMAETIDLDNPAVQEFVGAMAQFGLLDGDPGERMARILSGQKPGV